MVNKNLLFISLVLISVIFIAGCTTQVPLEGSKSAITSQVESEGSEFEIIFNPLLPLIITLEGEVIGDELEIKAIISSSEEDFSAKNVKAKITVIKNDISVSSEKVVSIDLDNPPEITPSTLEEAGFELISGTDHWEGDIGSEPVTFSARYKPLEKGLWVIVGNVNVELKDASGSSAPADLVGTHTYSRSFNVLYNGELFVSTDPWCAPGYELDSEDYVCVASRSYNPTNQPPDTLIPPDTKIISPSIPEGI